MEISQEILEAVCSEISHLHFAEKHFPNVTLMELRACACMGPVPECFCRKRARLVKEFLSLAQPKDNDG